MSQNIPWMAQMPVCSACGFVIHNSEQHGSSKQLLICSRCVELSWKELRMYAEGLITVSELKDRRVTKGYMFRHDVISIFAINLPRLMDKDGFKRWWNANTIGEERDPKMSSFDNFISRVIARYNELAQKRLQEQERQASQVAPEGAPLTEPEAPAEPLPPQEEALPPSEPEAPAARRSKKSRRHPKSKRPDTGDSGEAAAPKGHTGTLEVVAEPVETTEKE